MNNFDNVQTILDFLMKNADKLPASKIAAFSQVLEAIKEHKYSAPEPNEGLEISMDSPIMEETPINLADITGFTINGGKQVKVK